MKKLTKSYESEIKIQVKLIEQNPDGYDGSDGFSKALTIANENHNAEIANNQSNLTNISKQNLKNNVNNTTEKNQGSSDVPVKPSDPSDPSANLDNNENKGIDKKQDKEIHGTPINKSENSPSCCTKASPPSPIECDDANNTKEKLSSVSARSISLDSLVVCKDESSRLFTCPHCTKFKSNLESEYERHIVLNHPRKPGYPNTAAVG